tara:strand:- start:623 stop:727 length:105 start_codon:yes stop_codon:yes gene_type:complete
VELVVAVVDTVVAEVPVVIENLQVQLQDHIQFHL